MPDVISLSSLSQGKPFIELARLIQLVALRNHRIEIQDDAGQSVVLISKADLDSLESALDFLTTTTDMKSIAHQLAAVAHVMAHGPLIHAGDHQTH